MGVDARPAFSVPRASASFTHKFEASRSKACPTFLCERVSDKSLVTECPSSTPNRAIEARIGVRSTICAGPIDFERPTIVEHPCNRSANDCHPDDSPATLDFIGLASFNRRYSHAEFRTRHRPMMAVPVRNKSVCLFQRHWNKYQF